MVVNHVRLCDRVITYFSTGTAGGKLLAGFHGGPQGRQEVYVGTISKDGNTIAGQWEFSKDGKHWEVDFDLTFQKSND